MTSHSENGAGVPDLRGWAHKKLFLMPPASAEHARRAFVHRLLAEDFSPSPQNHAAWAVLRGQALPAASWLLEEAVLDQEAALRQEVEEFASSFFQTPPDKRRSDWQRLRTYCQAHPNLLSRIDLLEEGLDLYLKEIEGDPAVRELAETVGKLFVMAPGEAAVRRRAILAAPLDRYPAAARSLREQYPRIAALEPGLLDGLTRNARRAPPQSAGGKQRWATAPRPAAQPARPAPSSGGGNWHWLWIILVIGIIRLASSSSCRDEKRRGAAPPVPIQDINRDAQARDRLAQQKKDALKGDPVFVVKEKRLVRKDGPAKDGAEKREAKP